MIKNCTIHRNNPAFSANIEFCEVNKIEKCLKQGIEVSGGRDPLFSIGEAQFGIRIGTMGMQNCNALGITGKKTANNLVMHLCSCSECFFNDLSGNLIKLGKKIREAKKVLLAEGEIPEGLIFGGNYFWSHSKDLTVILKYCLEKYGIKPTIFTGAIDSKNAFYNGEENKWLVNGQGLRSLKKQGVIADFSYVRISPEDRVKFSDTDWISGKDCSLNKGELGLTIEDVLNVYEVDPKKLELL